jgi:hypothetical protein
MDPMRPKLIYLTARHPSLAPPQFVARWRAHGALGMSLPRWRNIARYVHCDVLHDAPANAALDAGYDGVGLIWHRSPAARRAHLADTSSREQMEQDELATFARPIGEVCVVTAETVLEAPRTSGGGAKLFRFAWPASRESAEPIRTAALASATRVRLIVRDLEPCGHVVNVPLPPERGDRWGLDVAVVEELWFDSAAAAAMAAQVLRDATAGDALVRGGKAHDATASEVLVVTNEVPLYELAEDARR